MLCIINGRNKKCRIILLLSELLKAICNTDYPINITLYFKETQLTLCQELQVNRMLKEFGKISTLEKIILQPRFPLLQIFVLRGWWKVYYINMYWIYCDFVYLSLLPGFNHIPLLVGQLTKVHVLSVSVNISCLPFEF